MTDSRTLSDEDLNLLQVAGSWGLLRQLDGHTVCMTGRMSMQRAQLAVLVDSAGGAFVNTMTSAVTILIVADEFTWTNKLKEAEKRGTRIITESTFAAELLPTVSELLLGARVPFGYIR